MNTQPNGGVIRLKLPWPPSINSYWLHTKTGQTFITPKGRKFRQVVMAACLVGNIQPMTGRLDILIHYHPPDRRIRDIDNLQKALMDAMKHGGCMADDSQVKHMDVTMHDFAEANAGRVFVTLRRIAGSLVQEEIDWTPAVGEPVYPERK